jgi:hypothetical protein
MAQIAKNKTVPVCAIKSMIGRLTADAQLPAAGFGPRSFQNRRRAFADPGDVGKVAGFRLQ